MGGNNNNSSVETPLSSIVEAQLTSLDDTDAYASAWSEALSTAAESSSAHAVHWGGRGKGGRGLSRRTYQPKDVVIPDVSLEYLNDPTNVGGCTSIKKGGAGGSKILLQNATLKLLGGGKVYALIGRNGCGKSTLLRRIDAQKIPGFPPHLSTLYIPQEVFALDGQEENNTPLQIVLQHGKKVQKVAKEANQVKIAELEEQLDNLDLEGEEDADAKVEQICEEISCLEEEMGEDDDKNEEQTKKAKEALNFFGIEEKYHDTPTSRLSGGLRKKVMLSCALFARPDILMLDEPTNHLDIMGIVQLRRLIASCTASSTSEDETEKSTNNNNATTTILLVSHDVDLINDISTDVIHFAHQTLSYYPNCNYRLFLKYKEQQLTHEIKQGHKLEKERSAMMNTIDNLKKQAAGSSSVEKKKKIQKTISSRRKKLEKSGVTKDEKGHRWQMQKAGCGIKKGSINSIDASTRNKLSHAQLLKSAETNVAPVPDKAVQFVFRDTTCTWGEPLIMAMDVGHGYGQKNEANNNDADAPTPSPDNDGKLVITKKPGMLFDCVDLCIDEGSRTCILGSNGSGKSTLLRILAGREDPLEGKVHRAHNVNIGYFHQHIADGLIENAWKGADNDNNDDKTKKMVTPLSLMTSLFPLKTEQDLRGELTSFGLNPQQATTNVKFLSGGERCRLCLAITMMKDPHVLILDEPTNHLDVESVEALSYGLNKWNGTVILVSHDANLIRTIGGSCYVIMEEEGKIRRVMNGIDSYLKSFKL